MLVSYIQKSLKNSLVYGLSTIIGRGINFLFLPFFLSNLSLREIGLWDFYQMWQSLGSILISSCATVSMLRFILLYKDDPTRHKYVIGNAFLLMLGGIGILLISWLILFLCNSPYAPDIYGSLTAINLSGVALFSLVITYFRSKEFLGFYLGIFLIQNFIVISCTVWGVYHGYGILSFFYANLLSLIPALLSFFFIFSRHLRFSKILLKEQLSYSFPIIVSSVLFTLFFSIDRLFLRHYAGLEMLGWYSLLWRFGAIFQILSVTIADTWPIVLFSAQKEKNPDQLISQLIIYFCLALLSGYLIALLGARLAIAYFLSPMYHTLIDSLPLFFLPIVVVSLSQLFNAGFGLAKKTWLMPFLALGTFCLQALLLWIGAQEIERIFIINTLAFGSYAIFNYYCGSYFYGKSLSNTNFLYRIFLLFSLYVISLHYLFTQHAPWYLSFLVVASWPPALWMLGIIKKEVEWMYAHFYSYIMSRIMYQKKEHNL